MKTAAQTLELNINMASASNDAASMKHLMNAADAAEVGSATKNMLRWVCESDRVMMRACSHTTKCCCVTDCQAVSRAVFHAFKAPNQSSEWLHAAARFSQLLVSCGWAWLDGYTLRYEDMVGAVSAMAKKGQTLTGAAIFCQLATQPWCCNRCCVCTHC